MAYPPLKSMYGFSCHLILDMEDEEIEVKNAFIQAPEGNRIDFGRIANAIDLYTSEKRYKPKERKVF